jgi:hypothetical protein
MTRVPTVKQMRLLMVAADPRAAVVAPGAPWRTLIARGWVAPLEEGLRVYRITPMGLRALADAIETHGYDYGEARDTGRGS